MTQSYNLSQLANNLNTAGQLDATDGLVGAVPPANGGTGLAAYTVGDLLYASGVTSLSKLPDIATGSVLISGGVAAAPSYGKVGLTTHISGTLPVANGGTGATTLTANAILIGAGTSAVTGVSPGASGQVLTSNGTAWSSTTPASLGVGQSWQIVARNAGTNYTNSTGKPIVLQVSAFCKTTSNIAVFCDGFVLATYQGASGIDIYGTVSAIIPNGSVYGFSTNGTPTSVNIFELR